MHIDVFYYIHVLFCGSHKLDNKINFIGLYVVYLVDVLRHLPDSL